MKKSPFIVLLLFLLCVSTSLAVNTSRLQFYYSFDNGTFSGNDVYDLTGKYNATVGLSTAPRLGDPGLLNQSVYFGGLDYIETNSYTDDFCNARTISFAEKVNNSAPGQDLVFGTGDASDYWSFSINDGGNSVQIYTESGGNDWGITAINSTLIDELKNLSWHFLTVSHRGGTVNTSNTDVYLNNRDITDNFIDGWVTPGHVCSNVTINDWHIGTRGALDQYFKGWIDEFQYYDYPINFTEHLELYNNGTLFNPTAEMENLTIPGNETNQTNGGNQTILIGGTDLTPLTNMIERLFLLIGWVVLFAFAALLKGRTGQAIGLLLVLQTVIGVYTGIIWLSVAFLIGLPVIVLSTALPMIVRVNPA